jgi:serine/threonine protein kinase
MSLPEGTRLGSYHVFSLLGEGGMGQVYRATDLKLKRTVALKVLPEAVAGDADRLARFQREAEILAALNHPNIAAIYGLETTPSPGSGHGSTWPRVMGRPTNRSPRRRRTLCTRPAT